MNFFAGIEQGNSEVARLLLEHSVKNNVVAMHYGAPFYDFLSSLSDDAKESLLNINKYIELAKVYETSKGSYELREAIASWYRTKHGLQIDPDSEIIVTNGSVEAFSLAVLCTSEIGDEIAITNPTYMLFANAIKSIGRKVVSVDRGPNNDEYSCLIDRGLKNTKALVINSPENPTGYVMSKADWNYVADALETYDMYLIQDEILGCLDFSSQHMPAYAVDKVREKSLLINGFSKVFGMPGIKIGWLIASPEIIKKAEKYHDYLYLGVNSFSEQVASSVLSHPSVFKWLDGWKKYLSARLDKLQRALTENDGYSWPRQPKGGLCVTPNISLLYSDLPRKYQDSDASKGASVANYLFHEKGVCVTPASIYGNQLNDYVKIVLCNADQDFEDGLRRLRCAF